MSGTLIEIIPDKSDKLPPKISGSNCVHEGSTTIELGKDLADVAGGVRKEGLARSGAKKDGDGW